MPVIPALLIDVRDEGTSQGRVAAIDFAGAGVSAAVSAGVATVTISGGGGGDAPADGTYVTLTTNGTLTNERVLTAGTAIGLTDGGAGSTITVAVNDAELTALAGLTSAADKLPYFTGSGTAALADFTAAGRAIVDDADASAQRTTLGLVIGTNVQAYDAELAALAGLTSAADKVPYFTGSGTAAVADFTAGGRALVNSAGTADTFPYFSASNTVTLGSITAAGRAILDDADATAQRTTLGLAIGTNVQAYDATLAAWAAYNTNGILTQTAADTFTGRTITGTANQVSVSNGDGVAGNPTLSTPQDIHTAATPTFASLTLTNGLVSDTDTFVVDATNNRVGIGTAAPAVVTDIVTQASSAVRFTNYAANTTGANFQQRKARGTLAAPRRALTSDALGGVNAFGAEAADNSSDATFGAAAGLFRFIALEDFTASGHGSRWELGVTGIGGTSAVVILLGSTTGLTVGSALTARGTTDPTNAINIFDGTAPAGTLTNGVTLYSASGELRVMDAAGNATLLSPHDPDGRWIHDEVNHKGRRLHVEMERLVKAVDALLGGGYIQESGAE